MEQTDEAIAKLVQRGDVQSFRVLMERYEPKIARYARKFLFYGDEAQDVVQDVFFKAYANILSFDAEQRFSPWIYRIAHNTFINAIKKREKEKGSVSIFDVDVLFPHPVAKETADADANREEMRSMLDASLATLDPKYREPLVLYYFEELNYKEIAEILHIPIPTIGIRLKRGKALLKKNFTK